MSSQPALRVVEGSTSMDKSKALDAALSQIERHFGKGSIMRLGKRERVEIETIPSGSLGLDIALGVGGLPRGRVVEIYGPESSGKTTLALHAIAEAQKRGGTCAFVDAEHALDPIYARKLGVNIDDLLGAAADRVLDALGDVGIFLQIELGVLAPLADAHAVVAEPGARLLDHVAFTPRSISSPTLEMPSPYMISNSTCLNGGATLFLTTFTLVVLPTMSSRSLIWPVRRMSSRTLA